MVNLFRFLWIWRVVKQLADDLYRVLVKQYSDGSYYLKSEACYQIVDGDVMKEHYSALCNMVYAMTMQQEKINVINKFDHLVQELTWNNEKNEYE